MKVPTARMIETREIETAPSLVFDCSVGGDASSPLVLMLHGFCVSRYFWDNQIPVLAAAGYFAVAPNQRGYAAGARPDPTDFDNYRIEKLIGDANDIVTGVGHGARRFHLVGHDWGGSLAWIIADRWPERIASLTMLSRPHPASFVRALKIDLEQPHRSRHHQELLDPDAGAARRKREVGAGPFGAQRRSPRSHRKALVGDRQCAGHGSSARVVSRAR